MSADRPLSPGVRAIIGTLDGIPSSVASYATDTDLVALVGRIQACHRAVVGLASPEIRRRLAIDGMKERRR